MNVHRVSHLPNEDIDSIKNDLLSSDNHRNEDMSVALKGYTHNNSGFVLTVSNIEKITNFTFAEWEKLIQSRGYSCEFQSDYQEGWIDVKCYRHQRKACFKAATLSSLGYLSIILICISVLCYRQNKMHLE